VFWSSVSCIVSFIPWNSLNTSTYYTERFQVTGFSKVRDSWRKQGVLIKQGRGDFSVRKCCSLANRKCTSQRRWRLSVCRANQSGRYFCSLLLGCNLFLVVPCKLFWVQLMICWLNYQHGTFRSYILLHKAFCKLCFKLYLILEARVKCFHSSNQEVCSTTKPRFPVLPWLTGKSRYFHLSPVYAVTTKQLYVTKEQPLPLKVQ
jgi:hypothetical protein